MNFQPSASLLIFGAGLNQLELIREAKLLGIETVVIDPTPNPPGKEEADFFYQVDGKDYSRTKEIAIQHHVRGIVTGQMEKPLRLMARLAEEMGYIFHSPEVVDRSLDKWQMKQAFINNNIPCAKAILLSKDDQITKKKLKDFSYPLIIKPKDAFSSRGVYKVDNYDDLIEHLEESRSFASAGDILIEEFIIGKEYSVETITYKGKTKVVQITEKFITPYPNTVEIGHLQPAPLDAATWEQVTKTVENAILAIGINNSASHAEVMVTTEGVFLIEIGARLGGDFISSYLTKASTGVSMDKAAVQIALGIEPDLTINFKQFSFIKYIQLPVNKRVVKIEPIDDFISMPGIVFATIFVYPGETIKPLVHSALRPACILTIGETRKQVIDIATKYSNDLSSRIILE